MDSKKQVLIVEDDEPLLSVLAEKFAREGYVVGTAKNGDAGYKKALAEHPDIILLDIAMPIMDGITMLNLLRQDEWGKKAKVIMLTNLSDSEEVSKALEMNAHDYLIKSDWQIEDVVKKVKEKLAVK